MENLPRNLEKELNALKLPQPSKRKSLWSLYFVSDEGNIITLNRFKFIAIAMIMALLLAIGCCVLLFFQYFNENMEKKSLLIEIKKLESKIAALASENENLNARVGISEAKLNQFSIVNKSGYSTGSKPESKDSKPKIDEKIQAQKSANEKKQTPVQPEKIKPIPEEKANDEDSGSVNKVTVEDVSTVYIQITEMLKIKFAIKKTTDDTQTLSGYTFVIFKPEDDDPQNWFTIPTVNLKDEIPENIEKGQPFSISRFKTVSFRAKGVKQPQNFKKVTVLVYSKAGDILFEGAFPVNIE